MGQPDAARIAAALARAGHDSVRVVKVTALSGGASSATWAVDAVREGALWPLILQTAAADRPGAMPKPRQAALQQLAGVHGVPVAAVEAVLPPADGLGDGFIMARIAGESLAPRWLRLPEYTSARAAMTKQCAQALARLHAVPLTEEPGLPGGSVQAQLAALFALYRALGADIPAFDLAFAGLFDALPDRAPACIVHGDFRAGNFIVGSDGLRAVLDWELAHLGQPGEDLAWLCGNAWRFGHWDRAVGGFGHRGELYEAYEAAGGAAVDAAEQHAWEVLGALRWGLSCLQLADDHRSGRVMSIERATVGRRVSEVEADILHLLRYGDL